jgi:hypothetical protein
MKFHVVLDYRLINTKHPRRNVFKERTYVQMVYFKSAKQADRGGNFCSHPHGSCPDIFFEQRGDARTHNHSR